MNLLSFDTLQWVLAFIILSVGCFIGMVMSMNGNRVAFKFSEMGFLYMGVGLGFLFLLFTFMSAIY